MIPVFIGVLFVFLPFAGREYVEEGDRMALTLAVLDVVAIVALWHYVGAVSP